MNNCIRCGKEMKKEAKFCSACGQSQTKEQSIAKTAETVLEKSVQMQQNLNEQLNNNQTVQQLKEESKNYFSWLNAQIKGKDIIETKRVPIFGVVNFLVLIVLNSIAISRSIAEIGYSKDTLLTVLIESLLVLGAYFFIFVLTFFLMRNQFMKKNMLFSTAFDLLFSPASLAIYVSLFSVLITFLVPNSFPMVAGLFCLSALIVSFSFVDNIWRKEGVFGRYSVTLVTLFFSFVIISFFFQLLGGSLLIKVFVFNLFR